MARIRTIKPEFWVDDQMVELEFSTRLLFIGLWNFVDDEGFIEFKPKRIKMQVFPADDLDVSRELRNLLELNRLLVCASDQGDLLQIVNWKRHQKISNPTPTKFTGITPKTLASKPISLEESVPVEKSSEGSVLKGKEGKGSKDLSTDGERVDEPKSLYSEAFLDWWQWYPRKESKRAAWFAWEKLRKSQQLPLREQLIASVKAYAGRVRGKEAQFIKLPAGWLNDGKWDDVPTTTQRAGDTDWALRM